MDIPILHPTDIRFHLEKIGINPSDDHSVVLGYGCLRLLEQIVKEKKWHLPHAAYQKESNHAIFTELFSEIIPAIDTLFETSDFWKTFNRTYEQVIRISFPDFIRNVYHGGDLRYVFRAFSTSWRPFSEIDERISANMVEYFANFAKTGIPSGNGLATWDPITADDPRFMRFGDDPCEMYSVPEEHLMSVQNRGKPFPGM